MYTLWGNRWIATPVPQPVPGGLLLEVEATVPVLRLGAVHARDFGSKMRRTLSFAFTDGPVATRRKVRSKRAEPAYTGDYHVVAALGRPIGPSPENSPASRVMALAPRAPRCASALLVDERLARVVGDDFGAERLAAFVAAFDVEAERLAPLMRQSYLYSAMTPPEELEAALDAALEGLEGVTGSAVSDPSPTAPAPISPPRLDRAAIPGGPIDVGRGAPAVPGTPPLAILGAGDYVRIEVAPGLADAALERAVLADREPQIAAIAAAELGFRDAAAGAEAAIDSLPRRGLVIVATAHDSHSRLAARALEAGHRVLCEKPAVVTAADLDLLDAAAAAHPGELEIGFNRRYHPLVERARRVFAAESGPATIAATIREVDITPHHWYLWPNQGTRVAGNLCHWIDLALHLLGPEPTATEITVSARVSSHPTGLDAERTFSIAFDDGSAVSLTPTGRGDSIRGVQEQIEVRRGMTTVRIDDLWSLSGVRAGLPIRARTLWRDKGHERMYSEVVARFEAGRPASYPMGDLRRVGEIQVAATELIMSGDSAGGISELVQASRFRAAARAPASPAEPRRTGPGTGP